VPVRLQPLDQQTLCPFDRDTRHRSGRLESLVEAPQPVDIIAEPALLGDPARRVEDTQLIEGVTPVQPDKHTVVSRL